MEDQTPVRILKIIAQTRLRSTVGEPITEPVAGHVLSKNFGESAASTPPSETELAAAALDLLSQDPEFAEPIRLMKTPSSRPQQYIEPAIIALTTAVLLVLQTRIKFKADQSGKWSVDIDKKSAGDATLKLVIQRLLPFLQK